MYRIAGMLLSHSSSLSFIALNQHLSQLSLLEGSSLHLSSLTNPRLPYSSSILHPHAIASSTPVSSLLFPETRRSPSATSSLYRCTRREIATWGVTVMVWKMRYLQTPFLAEGGPPVPPTMLATTWSIRSLPSFPRCPRLSTARVATIWLRSYYRLLYCTR